MIRNPAYLLAFVPVVLFIGLMCFNGHFRRAVTKFVGRHKLFFTIFVAALLVLLNFIGLQGMVAWLPFVFSILAQLAFAVAFMALQFWAMMYFMSRPRMYWVMPGETGSTFADYKGNPEVLEQARRVVEVLRGIADVKAMGGKIITGVLLEGPPGTGKSYLAQCIANEAGVAFGYCSSASLQSAFMGMGALTIWRLYRKARGYGKAIIFLDEIDAIGMSRASQSPGTGGGVGIGGMFFGGSGILNELLMQMDPPPVDGSWKQRLLRLFGLRVSRAEKPSVVTIAATNLAAALDPALMRAGRFSLKIRVNPPSAEGRREVIEYYLGKITTQPGLDVARLVFDMIYYTPADISHVINMAVLEAYFNGRHQVTYEDITAARQNHEMGIAQPTQFTELDRKRLAYHEGGHAVASVLAGVPGKRTARATIVPRGSALGMVVTKPFEERHTITKEEYQAEIDLFMASRASEELFLDGPTSGFSGDIHNATSIARDMVMRFAMGKRLISADALGISPSDPQVVREVESVLQQSIARMRVLLKENEPAVHAIAKALMDELEVDGPDVERIICEAVGKPVPAPAGLTEV